MSVGSILGYYVQFKRHKITLYIRIYIALNNNYMTEYIVGYYTPNGRRTITIVADSREAARTEAYSRGYQVIDVSLD